MPAYGMSLATNSGINLANGIKDCLDQESSQINRHTVFNIASISKTIIAATILRMTEDPRFAKYFSQNIDTKLNSFIPQLKSPYPHLESLQQHLEKENNFDKITLRNLLNHTSGIGDFDCKDFGENLRFESPESLKLEPDGKFFSLKRKLPQPEFGKYSYSNLGYEMLGMIIAAVGSAAYGKEMKCGEIVRELIFDRLNLHHSFTQDQMEFANGKVQVINHPNQSVAQAYDAMPDGKIHPSLVFRRALATSGIYSTPEDLCNFASAFFSNKTFAEGGLFDKSDTIKIRDSEPVKINDRGDFYAIGYEAYSDKEVVTKLHGAETAGFFGWLGYREGKVACCLINCRNKEGKFPISPIAAEKLSPEKPRLQD